MVDKKEDNVAHGFNSDAIEAALAIRTARAVTDHIERVEGVQRLAVEETLKDNEELREQILRAQAQIVDKLTEFLERHGSLAGQLGSLVEQVAGLFEALRQFKPPRTEVTLEQQPVNVQVETPQISVTPEINMPEPKVVIETTKEGPKAPPIKSAVINHSDGSQSTITIKR